MISVIIPVYNTADYLRRCIHSVLQSVYEDFELILVDDGSEDHSAFICQEYCERDCRVKYFKQEHKGVSAARNKGIEESRGTWITFVDSDDFISPNFLEMIAREEYREQDLLLFDFIRLKKGRMVGDDRGVVEREICRHYEKKDRLYLIRCLLNMERLRKNGSVNLASPWAKAYKKAVIDRHRLRFREDLAICEDRLFNVEYILKAKSCVYVQRQVYFAEIRTGSAMRGFFPDFLQNDIRYQQELCSVLKSYGIFPKVEDAYYNSVLSNMTDILVRGIFHPLSTRTYEESRRQCDGMQSVEIYREAMNYKKGAGNLPRKLLLFFYCQKKYHVVKFICRISYRILEMTGRL